MKTYLLSLIMIFSSALCIGQSASALDFDGINDRVVFGSVPFYQNSFTIEGWVNSTDMMGGGAIFNANLSSNFTVQGIVIERIFNSIMVRYRNPPATSGGLDLFSNNMTVFDGNWHHFAVVKGDDDILSLYIDGVFDIASAGPVLDFGGAVNLTSFLSYNADGDPRYLDGMIDEFRLWNIARDPADIAASMGSTCSSANFDDNGLVACYTFDNPTDPVVDETGNGNNGMRNPSPPSDAPQYVASTSPVDAPDFIPTMGQWGMIILGLLMSSLGLIFIRKRQAAYC